MKRIKLADEVMLISLSSYLLKRQIRNTENVFKGIVSFLDITENKFLQTADNIDIYKLTLVKSHRVKRNGDC